MAGVIDRYSDANLGIVRRPEAIKKVVGPVLGEYVWEVPITIKLLSEARPDFKRVWSEFLMMNSEDLKDGLDKSGKPGYPVDGITRILATYLPGYEEKFQINFGEQIEYKAPRLLLVGLRNKVPDINIGGRRVDLAHPLVSLAVAANSEREQKGKQIELVADDKDENRLAISEAMNTRFWNIFFSRRV